MAAWLPPAQEASSRPSLNEWDTQLAFRLVERSLHPRNGPIISIKRDQEPTTSAPISQLRTFPHLLVSATPPSAKKTHPFTARAAHDSFPASVSSPQSKTAAILTRLA